MKRITLVAALALAALFTGLNMFHFPNYESDEGTYMGSAWAMFERGELSYYTYNYDHPFIGWFQIGTWAELVGGFLRFGTSINTGRVLMLLVAVLSTLLIFVIVQRGTGRTTAALLAAVIFATSPLGVSLHRQVWLDNIATLWLLVSLFLLLTSDGRLGRIVLSALAFGLAFWSKEIAIVFLLGMLYLVFVKARPLHRHFAIALWGATVATALSLLTVFAFLKDEFLPPGILWSSPEPHASLLETFRFQASREGNGSLLSLGSDFHTYFAEWIAADPYLMLGGLAAAGTGLLFWRRNRLLFGVSLLALSFVVFLGRGGVVLHFYVVPLLALLALTLGLFVGHMVDAAAARIRGSGRPLALAILVLTASLGIGAASANNANFTSDSTSPQSAATRWIANNLSSESNIIMDAYPWADLRDEGLVGGHPFWNAHYALSALEDPAVRNGVLGNDPRSIDYLVYSPSVDPKYSWINGQLNDRPLPLVDEAQANSDKIKTFSSKDWEVQILRVRKLHSIEAAADPILANTWESYKKRFVEDGRVVDPETDGLTTSEGQSYALLRAVYMNDREAFEKVWGWTKENLQEVRDDGLLAWKYDERTDGARADTEEHTATDADTDAALALLFAARQWNEPKYEEEALKVLEGVWEKETIVVGSSQAGKERMVIAGDWAMGDGKDIKPVINPSYFSPYAYKIFAEADPEHQWNDLVDSSYESLEKIGESPKLGGETGLLSDWISLDPDTLEFFPVNSEELSDKFSFDASRIPWRISLDYLWFYDDRALKTLEGLTFPRREFEREGRLFAAYDLDGKPTADYEDTSMYAGVLPGLLFGGDQSLAHQIFAEKILGEYTDDSEGSYWGENPDDYYSQNMAWFATAMMDGSMGNLWADEKVINWDDYPLLS